MLQPPPGGRSRPYILNPSPCVYDDMWVSRAVVAVQSGCQAADYSALERLARGDHDGLAEL